MSELTGWIFAAAVLLWLTVLLVLWLRPAPGNPPESRARTCAECSVLFTPYPRHQAEHNYCSRCAAPRRELRERRELVARWAADNWERLEKRAIRETEGQRKAGQRALAAMQRGLPTTEDMAVQQQRALLGQLNRPRGL